MTKVRFARSAETEVWQFALEFEDLRHSQVTATQLRWLVSTGLADHAVEATLVGAAERSFLPTACLSFLSASCFVLTPAGEKRFFDANGDELSVPAPSANAPTWNAALRELRYGSDVVKRFRGPAPNQEGILRAFQEDHWPVRIDDPLPPRHGQDPKRRLHDTINALNRNQKARLVRFSGDGTGEGVRWELIEPGIEA